MKRVLSFVLAVIMFCSVFSIAVVNSSAASKTDNIKIRVRMNHDFENEVFRLVNIERQKRNIPKLKMSKYLFDYAQLRAAEMCVVYRYPSTGKAHIRPDGTKATAHKGVTNENSACAPNDEYTPKEVVADWMKSAGHRRSILNKKFKTMGLGYAYSGGCACWAQDFDTANTKTNYFKKGKQFLTRNIKINKNIRSIYLVLPETYRGDGREEPLPKQFYVYTAIDNYGFGATVDYNSVTYSSSNKNIATVNQKGFVQFKKPGTVRITTRIKNTSRTASQTFKYTEPFTINLSRKAFVYNGKTQRPSVTTTIKDSKYKTWSAISELPSASTAVGDYNVYVNLYNDEYNPGNRQYFYDIKEEADFTSCSHQDDETTLKYTQKYTIIPAGTKFSTLKSGKGTASVYWSKQTQQTTGYILQYSTRKDFKTATSLKISGNTKSAKLIKNLKSGKFYYFRVRTYKAKALPVPDYFPWTFLYGYPDDFNYVHNFYLFSKDKNYIKNYYSTWSPTRALKIK